MTMKKLFATVCASVLLITALCGCSLNTAQTVATPDYAQVTELVTAYEDAYRDYVQNGDGEVMLVTANGVTPLGAECSSKYVKTADGTIESEVGQFQITGIARLKPSNASRTAYT